MKRQERLLAMMLALQERQRATAAELAEQFGVSERTVLRDVAALAAVDVPVFAERGRYGGIVLLPGTQLDLSRLGAAEAEVLQLLGLDLSAARQLGVAEPVRRVLAKAAAAQRRSRAREGSPAPPLSLSEVVTVDNRGWFETAASTDVAALAADLRSGGRLRIRYRRSGQAATRWQTVDPYGLLLRAGRWYLVADRDGHGRLYALSRLDRWEPTGIPRRLRKEVGLAGLARELADRLESPQRHEVVITAELDADRRDLAERILGSRILAVDPGSRPGVVTLRVGYPELDGTRQLLQFADHIRVLDPPEARRLVHDLAADLARRHGRSDP